jgi:serine phosphatase RsbU (regulator of sigma subunit)
MKQLYAPQEFPLLQAVHDLNLILYCAMTETIESPLSWSSISKDYFQNLSSSPSDSVSVSELLEIRKPLLFAIPLTVKNKVLGVMMIVEGDSSQKAPPHHIRMKRLEIITGISQQAALAIQNEAYQRENVQRERLEREMQLAREIQKTFLPENIPSSPGWDISIRWQPIYQVGGDFYDIFELPDGNIGFVIADVADKGMPAALFMTLVRTLLRAAIREKWSPAEVLKQVNDLLVPDAKNGMFVTLVYAILSRSTGIITYANAGHNPPLLRRDKLGKIELLLRTGMAIGIFDDVEINEKEIQIEPGDLLVFYTDGITDVFSPDEEMYGLERLIQLIESTQPTDPESLISVVEKSVRQFTLNQPLSDDITLAIFIKK